MRDVLLSAFPINIIGILVTTLAWRFFEGFNYVVISDKINRRYPSRKRWLNWGAFVCAVLCILIHGAIGVTADIAVKLSFISENRNLIFTCHTDFNFYSI